MSVYLKIPRQLPGMLTYLLVLADQTGPTDPSSLLSNCLTDRHLYPTVADCFSLVDCPGTLPFLIFFQSCRKSCAQALCVGLAPEQTKESSEWHSPTPTETNATHHATSGCLSKAQEPSLFNYLPTAGGRINEFIPLPRVLVICEMQSALFRI